LRKIIYSVAMSLDGFIAGPNGEYDWLVMDPEIDFGANMARFDTILMGRGTFEASQSMGGGDSMGDITTVVVSRTLQQKDHPDIKIVSDDFATELKRLQESPGKDIGLFGGGVLFSSLLDLGLVDTVEVAIVPVLLGAGVPLLPERAQRSKLRLANSRVYKTTGTVLLEYEVQK
jgi:dihydrofolate reductase